MDAERPLTLYGLRIVGPRGYQAWLFVAGLHDLGREEITLPIARWLWETLALPETWTPKRQLVLCDEDLPAYDTADLTFYAIRMSEERATGGLVESLQAQGYPVLIADPRPA